MRVSIDTFIFLPTLQWISPSGKQNNEFTHALKVQGRVGCFLMSWESDVDLKIK